MCCFLLCSALSLSSRWADLRGVAPAQHSRSRLADSGLLCEDWSGTAGGNRMGTQDGRSKEEVKNKTQKNKNNPSLARPSLIPLSRSHHRCWRWLHLTSAAPLSLPLPFRYVHLLLASALIHPDPFAALFSFFFSIDLRKARCYPWLQQSSLAKRAALLTPALLLRCGSSFSIKTQKREVVKNLLTL